jgi:hypothetical protein
MEIYKEAAMRKLRFATSRGAWTAEDLFDLPLKDLDTIARAVNKELKSADEESFIDPKPKASSELTLKLNILKDVIETKQEANKAAKARSEKRAQIDFLKNLLQEKEIDELKGKSRDEIAKQLAALEAEE